MKALNKDIIQEIKNTKSKFLSLIIIIFLGVFVFVGLEETSPTINKTLNTYFKESNIYDLQISNEFMLNKDDLDEIAKINSIEDSENYYYQNLKDVRNNFEIIVQSLPQKIAIPKIIKGHTPKQKDEIVLSESLSAIYKLNDYIEFKESIIKNRIKDTKLTKNKYKIVGFAYSVDFPENSTNNKANTDYFAYVNKENFDKEDVGGINVILKNIDRKSFTNSDYYENVNKKRDEIIDVLKKQNEKNNKKFKQENLNNWQESKDKLENYKKQIKVSEEKLESLKNFLPNDVYGTKKEELEKNKTDLQKKEEELVIAKEQIEDVNYPKFVVDNIKGNKYYSQLMDSAISLKSISSIFSVFLFLVAILVSLTTMTRMIDENRTNIGTMKSLGYSNFNITKKYYIYSIFSSLIGGIIGVFGAYKIIVPVVYSSYARLLTLNKPEINISFETIFLALILSIGCMLLAVYIPLRKILKEKSAYLLRPKAPKSGSRILLEYVPFIWKKLSFLQKVACRNIFRYKIRMLMTIFGVLGCLALMFVGFGIRYSVQNIAEKQFENITNYDIVAIYNPYITQEEKEKLQKIIKDTNNQNYIKTNIQRVTIEQNNDVLDNLTMFTLDNEEVEKYFTLQDENNNKLSLPKDGVIITEKLAYLHNLKKGSNFIIKLNDIAYEIKVAEIAKNYFGHNIYMSKEYYKEKIKNNYLDNSYLIKTNHDNENTKKLIEKLEENNNIIKVQNNLKFKDVLVDIINGIDIIVVVIVFCSFSLALVVLYNLININVSERIRELSTIKVLGFYPKEVTVYVFREIIYLVLIGIILGNYCGYKLYEKIILDLAGREMMFDKTASITVYSICSLVTMLIILIVMFIMHIKLKKVNMVEALKSVE